MMSVERSFEAWEEVQRQGLDLADKLAQGFSGLIQSHSSPPSFPTSFSPSFPWPTTQTTKLFDVDILTQNFMKRDFGLAVDNSGFNGVSAVLGIGNMIGQAGADIGACVNGAVQHVFGTLASPFQRNESLTVPSWVESDRPILEVGITMQEDLRTLAEQFRDYGYLENDANTQTKRETEAGEQKEEEIFGVDLTTLKSFARSQGTVNVTYDIRRQSLEGSLVARGDFLKAEASCSENSSLFLLQLGPLFLFRDSTLLALNWSKQHLLWYGYDKKHGVHSLRPAVWSKDRRWLLMSMFCLNPFSCSLMDLEFPNGEIAYVSGQGLSASAFLPVSGGLLQAQGHYPGQLKLSFSCKNKWGTWIRPMVQLPDKSFTLNLSQALAWKRSGIMARPTCQVSICPTIGGSCPGLHAEITHSLKEHLFFICGCALARHPTAFASLALGRSKWNGNVGTSGVVFKVEAPVENNGSAPSFSIQLNGGFDF